MRIRVNSSDSEDAGNEIIDEFTITLFKDCASAEA